jgi:hypothetical protein
MPSTAALTLVSGSVVDAVATASGATFRPPYVVPQVQSARQSPGHDASSAPSHRSLG